MHGLSHLYIENFRACRQVTLTLGAFTPLVGQNNVGKSTLLAAIHSVLAAKTLAKTDAADQQQPIVIAACIEGITDELIDLIPAPNHRKAIAPYVVKGKLWIRISGPGKPVQEVWDIDQPLDEAGLPTAWRKYPTGLPDAVEALLPEPLHIQAMDDVQEDLGKGKAGSTIRGLLDEIMKPLLKQHTQIQQALDAVRAILGKDGETRSPLLKNFDTDATTALSDLFPGLSLDMDVPTVDIKEFFKSGDLHVTDEITGERRRFDQVGTGAQRAIQMALIRLLADMRHGTDKPFARRMLLIDEPELFLHPLAVRTVREALKVLSTRGFQVVFATHSPLMINQDNAPDTVIVHRNRAVGAAVKKPLREAVAQAIEKGPDQARTIFSLGNVAEIYFADTVIVCEGKTDKHLLPILYEQLRGKRPDLEHISVVSLGGAGSVLKAMKVLNAMEVRCGAIVDLDFAFVDARKGSTPLLARDGADIAQAKSVLARLQPVHRFELSSDGLPKNGTASSASRTWSVFAADEEGATIAAAVHSALLAHGVWVWQRGCIEDILGVDDKGEEVIQQQEERIRGLGKAGCESELPEAKGCVDWMVQL